MKQGLGFRSLEPHGILEFPCSGIHLIEASAGTGKTGTIASLFVHFVLAGIESRRILVVTFTNAATEELNGRIRSRLVQALHALENPDACEDSFLDRVSRRYSAPDQRGPAIDRLKLAIRTLDEAAIFTIHGFCQRVLTDHAFNSGQAYDTELTTDESELWSEALEDWWRIQAYPLSAERLTLFLGALKSFDDFERLGQPLRAIQPPALTPEVPESLEELYHAWCGLKPTLEMLALTWRDRSAEIARILEESKALSRAQASEYRNERLSRMLEKIHAYFELPEHPVDPEIITYLSLASLDQHSTDKRRGTDPELRDPFFCACQALTERIHNLFGRFKIRALRDASLFARAKIEAAKKKSRIMTYDDQLIRLHQALGGPRGPDLAGSLRQSFPIAMIDEFQDTDAIQYGIFRAIYATGNETGLILIGDPKQSIYRFRGSDIFTYMQARRDAGCRGFTLDTNWRSTPALIQAVNAIFEFREAPFLYDDAIRFSPVRAAGDDQAPVSGPGDDPPAEAPLTIWKIPLNGKAKPHTQEAARELLARVTASEIARLLRRKDPAPVKPSDIAVLVRTNEEGRSIQSRLSERGIASVSITKDLIFHSGEAKGLELLLLAIAESVNPQAMRNALASNLLGLSYPEMDQIWSDEDAWQAWSDSLKRLGELWRRKGFMPMFHDLLASHGIAEKIARKGDAERRLSNLLHLAELLQEASRQHPTASSLLAWFDRQCRKPRIQETELRLESDADLVRIVTIHSSKGLEYPIVFLPFLWSARPVRDQGSNLIEYHDPLGQVVLDAGSGADSRKRAHRLAEKERLAEDLRLLYVALTRARSRIVLAWGRVNSGYRDLAGLSALGFLLHSRQNAADLDRELPQGFTEDTDLDRDLQRLAERSGGSIGICELPEVGDRYETDSQGAEEVAIALSEFKGRIAADWRIASFTAMTREIHQHPHHGSPRAADDPILNFPAGSRTGSFLHRVLENLDFQGAIDEQARELWHRFAPRFNFDSGAGPDILARWLHNIVNTRLDEHGLKLSDLPQERRLNELEFDFSILRVEVAALNRLLGEYAKKPVEAIEYEDFQGVVNGVIDLVFAHRGRYYIADYKTNYLGGSLDDYLPSKLATAVLDRRYDLQYLLYTLALHRYLKQRIPGYRYREHVGGVYYLFLRAMRPGDPEFGGVFRVIPEPSIVESLDRIIFAQAMEASHGQPT